jgi:hypothetical protein
MFSVPLFITSHHVIYFLLVSSIGEDGLPGRALSRSEPNIMNWRKCKLTEIFFRISQRKSWKKFRKCISAFLLPPCHSSCQVVNYRLQCTTKCLLHINVYEAGTPLCGCEPKNLFMLSTLGRLSFSCDGNKPNGAGRS